MKPGTAITGVVARFDRDGSGLIDRAVGAPLRVPGAIPGETVTGHFTRRVKSGPLIALDRVEVPSPHRVPAPCPLFGRCGGCAWQHVDYPTQRQAKLDIFRRIAAEKGVDVPLRGVRRAPDAFFYRNRMDFAFGEHGELGLRAAGRWWDVLDLPTCFLISPESAEIVNRVRAWARVSGLPFWNAHRSEGFLRYLVIREGKRTGERLVMLVTAAPTGDERATMEALPALLDGLATSVVWGVNPSPTDTSAAQNIVPLRGDPWIFEQVGGIRYKITPNAFFQTHTAMAERLQQTAKAFCGDLAGKTFLDLYGGSGFFSLFLAKSHMPKAKGPSRIIGIELSAEAIACAKENASANGVDAEYFVSKAEDFDWKAYAPDVVLLDPPRAGLHPKVIQTILDARPTRLVYVSCNYPRFLDEMRELGKAYRIADAAALDLFPQTPHMECVFLLEAV